MGQHFWADFLLFEVLRIIALYPTPRHGFRIVVLSAMIYVAAQLYLTQYATGSPAVMYCIAGHVFDTTAFTVYVLYAEGSFPDHWRRVRDEVRTRAHPEGNLAPSNFRLAEKFWWTLDLAYSLRMVGWVQEPRDRLPPPPSPSRRAFFRRSSLKLIVNVVIIDLTTLVYAQSPAFDSRVHDPTDGPETYLAAVPFMRRVPYVVAWALLAQSALSAFYTTVACVCVGVGNSSPTLWPDLWGHWEGAYTIRKLWGQTWHQLLRPTVSGFGRLVANKLLRFPRGTNRSSYTQLYVAFFLSGVIHSSGDYMLEKRVVFRSCRFFLLQAVAITFEDFITYVAKRLLLKRGIELKPGRVGESWVETTVRVIGYSWVTLWLCLTIPSWQDGYSVAGINDTDRKPIAQFLLDTRNHWA